MQVTYRIRDWAEHFEVSQSNKIRGPLPWVAVKTKHDGKGFRRLMAMKDGVAVYGAFHLIVQVAGKCPIKGTLADSDGPLSPEDMEAKTGCPAKMFEKAFEVLCGKGIRWMERIECSTAIDRDLPESTTLPLQSSTLPIRDETGRDGTERNETERDETNDCSEPPPAASEPVSASENDSATAATIMVFPCVGRGPTEWPLTDAKVAEYRQSFPGVDVLGECRKARQWCIDNSSKRKTFGGMPAFLSRWLSKEQDRAPMANGASVFSDKTRQTLAAGADFIRERQTGA